MINLHFILNIIINKLQNKNSKMPTFIRFYLYLYK